MTIEQFEQLVCKEVGDLTLSMHRNAGSNRQVLIRFLDVLNESETDQPEEASKILAHICALDMITNLIGAFKSHILDVLDHPGSQDAKEFAELVFSGKYTAHKAVFMKEPDEKN